MGLLTPLLSGLSPDERAGCYQELAIAALSGYSGLFESAMLLQHNAGITCRVTRHAGAAHLLLKMHDPVGDAPGEPVAAIVARMAWLAEAARTTSIPLQAPLPDHHGKLVATLLFRDLMHPIPCTLQRWVPGTHLDGDVTIGQARAVGSLLGQLHQISATMSASAPAESALPIDSPSDLLDAIERLRVAVGLGICTTDAYDRLVQAGQHIGWLVDQIGQHPYVWGAIHGDLHHGNLLFDGASVSPIDFDSMRRSCYALDLGTTLYHVLYQEVPIRAALVQSYQETRPLTTAEDAALEACVAWAAVTNLAFQITIPAQRASALFARNLQQLTDEFCPRVLSHTPFVRVYAPP